MPKIKYLKMSMSSESWPVADVVSGYQSVEGAGVTLYPQSQETFIAGRSIRCSRTHFRYLIALLANFCRTVPYERLLGNGGRELTAAEQNVLKVQMFHLRRLLEQHGAEIEIRNVYGRGYQARPKSRTERIAQPIPAREKAPTGCEGAHPCRETD